jgi:hypothetical protein
VRGPNCPPTGSPGLGCRWSTDAARSGALRQQPARSRDYTFATQILETYHFTRAIQVAVREFAPDRIILLGPGDTLGGAIAQALIAIEWRGCARRRISRPCRSEAPFLLAMGREEQRLLVTG